MTTTRQQVIELAKDTTLSLAGIGFRCNPSVTKQRVSVILRQQGIKRTTVYKYGARKILPKECSLDGCHESRASETSKFCRTHYGGKTKRGELIKLQCALEGCKNMITRRASDIERSKQGYFEKWQPGYKYTGNHFCSKEHQGRWLGHRNRGN